MITTTWCYLGPCKSGHAEPPGGLPLPASRLLNGPCSCARPGRVEWGELRTRADAHSKDCWWDQGSVLPLLAHLLLNQPSNSLYAQPYRPLMVRQSLSPEVTLVPLPRPCENGLCLL